MDGWTGQINKWMGGWMDERKEGWMDGQINKWMGGWVDGWMMGQWMDGWKEGRTGQIKYVDGWVGGCLDG